MLVLYGIHEDGEDWNPLTHLALLTLEETKDVEDITDFFHRFGHRLVVAEEVLLGREWVERSLGDILVRHAGTFVPALPYHRYMAYLGPAGEGHIRAYVDEGKEGTCFAVEVAKSPGALVGVPLAKGVAPSPKRPWRRRSC